MSRRLLVAICLAAAVAGFGCNVGSINSTKSQLAQAQAELAKTRHELKAAQEEIAVLKAKAKAAAAAPAKALSYLDELERLDSLRTKNVLTAEEFEAKKKAVMQASDKPPMPAKVGFTVAELADQFRTLQGLYNLSTINIQERDQKMQQLVDGPIAAGDLKTDLETVQNMYNLSVIGAPLRDALKKKILEREPTRP